MSPVNVLVMGVVLGASLVLMSLLIVAAILRMGDNRAPLDEALVISVRRMLFDPSVRDADPYIGSHLERIRKDMLRLEKSEE